MWRCIKEGSITDQVQFFFCFCFLFFFEVASLLCECGGVDLELTRPRFS